MKKIRNYLLFAVVILIIASFCGCSEEDDEIDVIGDLKDMVFDSFGNQTLEKAAEATMTDINWSYDDTPSYDGGAHYKASLTGKFRDNGLSITVNFDVLYKYKQMSGDKQEVEAVVESVTVNGEVYSDDDNIFAALSLIYGS